MCLLSSYYGPSSAEQSVCVTQEGAEELDVGLRLHSSLLTCSSLEHSTNTYNKGLFCARHGATIEPVTPPGSNGGS